MMFEGGIIESDIHEGSERNQDVDCDPKTGQQLENTDGFSTSTFGIFGLCLEA